MNADLKNSETMKNLMRAFAGEKPLYICGGDGEEGGTSRGGGGV